MPFVETLRKNLISQFEQISKTVLSALIFVIVLYSGLFLRKVFSQKRKNSLNELDLSASKINFENSTKPLDQLVTESNKSHAADEVVQPTGSVPKKE